MNEQVKRLKQSNAELLAACKAALFAPHADYLKTQLRDAIAKATTAMRTAKRKKQAA